MSGSNESGAADPRGYTLQVATGYMAAASLYAAAKLRIADLLAHGPQPVAELAQKSGGNSDALFRTLRALASIAVFQETSPGVFANTPASEVLLEHGKGSVRDAVLWLANGLHLRVYADYLHSVKTSGTAMEHVTGTRAFEYFEKNKEEGDVFNLGMTNFSALFSGPVLDAYDFGGLGTLSDIAGGHGLFLAAILEKHPELRGILFEMPYLQEAAKKNVESLGLSARCQVVSGDFFKAVPPADSYVMKSIIHDWDDGRASAILQNCANAMRGKGKVILVELVITPGNNPDFGKWIDIEMLALAGGRERTEAEFAALFRSAGLRLARVVRTKCPYCVLEAEKA